MSTRYPKKWLIIIFAFGLAFTATIPKAIAKKAKATQNKPNIVLFLVDDMGWQDTSVPFWNKRTPLNDRYHTPNMEILTTKGMKFTQAYACAVCSPTRVSLMTGLNATRHRVTNWTLRKNATNDGRHPRLDFPQWNVNGLSPTPGIENTVYAKALPKYLQEAGYRTIHVGKAHFGAIDTPGADPKNIGFDVNIAGHAAGGPASFLGKHNFSVSGRQGKPYSPSIWDIPGLKKYHGKEIYLSEALTREAIAAMDQSLKEDKPFFLYMSHYAVHAPIMKDDRFIEKYKGLHPTEAAYATMVEGMDKSLGDIMANIKKRGITDNTIILFMSDNGGLSAHARGGARHSHNKPLSSGKGSIHEGGIREPMIVYWPGITKPGSVCHDYLIIEDFFPTILELAGINYASAKTKAPNTRKIDGISFVPLLKGKSAINSNKHRALFWHYPNKWGPSGPGIASYSAIRKDDWKLIYYHDPGRKVRYELFNITNDISETTNLASKKPKLVKQLSKELRAYMIEANAQMPTDKKTGKIIPLPGL